MPPITLENLIIVIALISFFVAIGFVRLAIKTVPENKRVVIFRLGKSVGSHGPGIVTIIPFIDHVIWIDLQKTYHYEYNNLSTSDNQKISCILSIEGRIIDPEKSVLNVPNLENALSTVIGKEIKDIAGTKESDELINEGRWIESQLKDVLDRSSRSWGFEVTEIMIDDIQQT